MCCDCCSVRQQKSWVFGLGSFFTLLGIVMIAAWPTLSQQLIRSMLPLSDKSFMYNKWVTTPVPVYTSFYLFNWTNPQELNNSQVKPHYEQLGPYTFSDYKVKEDLLWQQPHVTYYGRRTFHFLPELSNGTLQDLVVTPHFPTVAAARFARKYRRFMRKAMNFALNREGGDRYMAYTAGEWMFDGFYNVLVDFVERLHSPLLPIYSSNFGWFYERNNSKLAEGNFTIHTGQGQLQQLGELQLWNGTAHTGYYAGECGKVNGSTGELWTPGRQWDDTISIFLPDAARFINLYAQQQSSVQGVDVWRYETTPLSFDNGQLSADSKCFCVPNRECPRNGVLDFSPKANYAPFYVSHPHFYMTDELYRQNTTGLQPDAYKHGMYVLMEPTLGVPVDLKGQLMISLLVEQDEAIDLLRDVAYDHYAPIFTLQMRAELQPSQLQLLKFALNVPRIGQYIGIALLLLGLGLLIAGLFVTKKHKWHNEVRDAASDKVEVLPASNGSNDSSSSR